MFIVKPDGSIACETIDEALQLQKVILSRKSASYSQPVFGAGAAEAMNRLGYSGQSITETPARAFLEKLKPFDGKDLDTDGLAKLFEVDSPTIVGPKLRGLRTMFERENLDLDDYLRQRVGDEGEKIWRVKFH